MSVGMVRLEAFRYSAHIHACQCVEFLIIIPYNLPYQQRLYTYKMENTKNTPILFQCVKLHTLRLRILLTQAVVKKGKLRVKDTARQNVKTKLQTTHWFPTEITREVQQSWNWLIVHNKRCAVWKQNTTANWSYFWGKKNTTTEINKTQFNVKIQNSQTIYLSLALYEHR